MRYWYAPLEPDRNFISSPGRVFTTPDNQKHAGLYVGEITKEKYDDFTRRRIAEQEEGKVDEFGLPLRTEDEFGLPL